MADRCLDLESAARLIRLAESRGLRELIVEDGAECVTIRREAGAPSGAFRAAAVDRATETAAPTGTPVTSPMVGVFYLAPGADQPSYVEPGDHVSVGQTIGLIEAMKVFSEVPSDLSGVCTRIAAASGQLVQLGDPLVYIAPDPATG
ncbi:MAG TPA: biotin/lipoyl-containing protein [Chthonomonadales bacterium]|nr:biotin/lipoyl-containing protein [Chthonomonadales bacterium]